MSTCEVHSLALLLLLALVGCPRAREDAKPPSPSPDPAPAAGEAEDTAEPRVEQPALAPRAAAPAELEAWTALQGRIGGWARLLPGELKDSQRRAALQPALEPSPALRRAALLARYLPLREKHAILNLEGPLRRHLGKNNLLDPVTFDLSEDRTVLLLVLMDPALLSRLPWWRDEGGWNTLHDALGKSADEELTRASRSLREGVEHAHAARWDQAATAWVQGLSAVARNASAREGKLPAWKAVDLSAQPKGLQSALETWWRGFVPSKPPAKQG